MYINDSITSLMMPLHMKLSILLIIFCLISYQGKEPQIKTFPPTCSKIFVFYLESKLLLGGSWTYFFHLNLSYWIRVYDLSSKFWRIIYKFLCKLLVLFQYSFLIPLVSLLKYIFAGLFIQSIVLLELLNGNVWPNLFIFNLSRRQERISFIDF